MSKGGGGSQEAKPTAMELEQGRIAAEGVAIANAKAPAIRKAYEALATRDMSDTLGGMASIDAQMGLSSSPVVNGKLNPLGSYNAAMAGASATGAGVGAALASAKNRQISGRSALLNSANKQSLQSSRGLGALADNARSAQNNALSNAASTRSALTGEIMNLGKVGLGAYDLNQRRTNPDYYTR